MKNRKKSSTYRFRKRTKADKRNKSAPADFVRWKSDTTVIRQHEIHQHIKQYGMSKDYWKLKHWWDFVNETHKIVVKITSKNYKINNSVIKLMKSTGWNVLFINYFDPNEESLLKLIDDIKFIKDKPDWIEGRAEELNDNLPKSEKWFRDKISKEWFYRKMKFEFNKPMFGTFIYDLFSNKYRLCIEVDGSAHETEVQQQKDLYKTNATRNRGFDIIRVQAYNEDSYKDCVLLIEQLIKNYKAKTYSLEKQEDFNNKINEIEKSGKLPF